MTDDTRDRGRPLGDAGNHPEAASDGQADQPPNFGFPERTAEETGDSARSTAGPSTGHRTTVTETSDGPDAGASAGPDTESNGDRIEERLGAVERALTGTDDAVADLGDEAAATAEREELSRRLDELEARIEELEAATQAIRGYVGSVRSVNQAIERRADLALAKASESGGAAAGDRSAAPDGTNADGEAPRSEAIPDGETPRGEAIPSSGAAADDGVDDGVPSEADLDAAVPADRRRGNGTGPGAEPGVDRSETDGENADDSWRSEALDRLRDSL